MFEMKCINSIISLVAGTGIFLCADLPVSYGQQGVESFNVLKLETFRKMPVNERIVLFTDREVYLCGEKILFSAYSYEGNWFLPLSLSSVLYVELYNQDNSVISKSKFLINNGKGSGAISIPRTIHSDIYYIRAYTNYMKNFGVKQFFVQKLKIVNPNLNVPDYPASTTDSTGINCRIFPEGGTLIDGIRSRVGCRFTDNEGKGIQVIARLVDMNKNIITTFRTYKNGFTSFEFVPQTGFSYNLEAVSNYSQVLIRMPQSVKNGLSLTIDTLTSEYLGIRINSNDPKNFPVRLNARHGELLYPLHETLINSAGVINVPLQRIPQGLISLELNNFEGKLISTRLSFLKPYKKLNIELNTNRERYGPREEVNLMINARDDKGSPLMTDLVLFTYLAGDELSLEGISDPGAGLLSQDLMKIIINDNDLIINAVKDKKLLDIVLLLPPPAVQKDTSSHDNSIFYLPEPDGDIISGKLLYNDNRPASGIKVLQSFVGKISCVESFTTDNNGRFYFKTGNEKNKGDLILRIQKTDKETKVILDNEFSDKFPEMIREKFRLTKNEIDLINKQFINIQVEDAFLRGMENTKLETVRDTIPFYGSEGSEFTFSEYVKLPNMKEFLFEIILGVINVKENKTDKIILVEENTLKRIGPDPLILIDGIPVTESEIVIGLDAEKVESVRIVRNKFFYKNQVFDGIMDISSIYADGSVFNLPANTFRSKFEHINEGSPIIEAQVVQSLEGKIPQYKNLLYWNSTITTDKEGKTALSFITPDNKGSFRIKCIGITPENLAGSESKIISVGE